VSIVRSDEKYVFIGSGLLDGQLICTTLLDSPLPGTPVRYELPAISGLGVSSSND